MDLIKIGQILYTLFPLFFTIVLFGLIFKKGWKFLSKFKWFWLLGMVVTGIICIDIFLSSSVKGYTALMSVIAFGNCYSAYKLLKQKDKKKK